MHLAIKHIRAAAARIAPYVPPTPVLHRRGLILEAESLTEVGSFKIRGAFSFMTPLDASCPGVVTHSSGNHAQAVARAARRRGV